MVGVSCYPPNEDELIFLANFTSFKPDRESAKLALQPIHAFHPSSAKVAIFCQPTSFEQEYRSQANAKPSGPSLLLG